MISGCLLLLALFVAAALWLIVKNSGSINASGRLQNRGRPPFRAAATSPFQASVPSAEISDSGLFSATAFYRVKDGSGDYHFRFQQIAEASFRVYILQTPRSKNGADSGSPHVLRDDAEPFICWSVPIEDYEDAKEIASRWAEATEKWHKTGKTF